MVGVADCAGADQLQSLLAPDVAAAGKDPHRSDAVVVIEPAHDGGVAVSGQCDGSALLGGADSAGTDQLQSLLAPDTAAARKNPRRAGLTVVVRPALDRSVAVCGQRDRVALEGVTDSAGADQLRALLGELGIRGL